MAPCIAGVSGITAYLTKLQAILGADDARPYSTSFIIVRDIALFVSYIRHLTRSSKRERVADVTVHLPACAGNDRDGGERRRGKRKFTLAARLSPSPPESALSCACYIATGGRHGCLWALQIVSRSHRPKGRAVVAARCRSCFETPCCPILNSLSHRRGGRSNPQCRLR
jgi:hypothetical protein